MLSLEAGSPVEEASLAKHSSNAKEEVPDIEFFLHTICGNPFSHVTASRFYGWELNRLNLQLLYHHVGPRLITAVCGNMSKYASPCSSHSPSQNIGWGGAD